MSALSSLANGWNFWFLDWSDLSSLIARGNTKIVPSGNASVLKKPPPSTTFVLILNGHDFDDIMPYRESFQCLRH